MVKLRALLGCLVLAAVGACRQTPPPACHNRTAAPQRPCGRRVGDRGQGAGGRQNVKDLRLAAARRHAGAVGHVMWTLETSMHWQQVGPLPVAAAAAWHPAPAQRNMPQSTHRACTSAVGRQAGSRAWYYGLARGKPRMFNPWSASSAGSCCSCAAGDATATMRAPPAAKVLTMCRLSTMLGPRVTFTWAAAVHAVSAVEC